MIPYVVSQDIRLLLTQWGEKQGFKIPLEAVLEARSKVERELRRIFRHLVVVGEDELLGTMCALAFDEGHSVVSLDRVFTPARFHLDLTRAITPNREDAGFTSRDPTITPRRQVEQLAAQLHAEGIDTVVLADDVVFSGNQMLQLINELHTLGIRVASVVAGVVIGEGQARLAAAGVKLAAVRRFDNVIDEVCERDFFPGLPFAGRTLKGDELFGAPYLLPFGRPQEWASIPTAEEQRFSRVCLHAAITLFEAIATASDRQVYGHDLNKVPLGCSPNGVPFVQELRRMAATF